MGVIESKVKITKNRRMALDVLLFAGLLPVVLVAPSILSVFKKLGIDKKFQAKEKYSFFRTLKQLESKGLVVKITKKGKDFYELTSTGRMFAGVKDLTTKKKWDKKWRVLIFDIPEYKKSIREKIRNSLRSWGFMRLQDSVWVFPYSCEDYITLLKADLRVGKELLYMVVEEMENDKEIKKFFCLENY